MEQGTWLTILSGAISIIGFVLRNHVAALKALWLKMEACEASHANCREELAKIREQNGHQARQISALQEEALRAKRLAEEAEQKADAAHERLKGLATAVKLRKHLREGEEVVPDDLESK